MWTTASILWFAGCAMLQPGGADQLAYAEAIQPLLAENTVLADEVLGLAAEVYNDNAEADVDALTEAWRTDVVPLAEHLHAQAALVKPPDAYIERHKDLVTVWASRAEAYRDLSEALALSDAERWAQARELANEVKLEEEEWFRTINADFGQNGLLIDQFP